MMRFLAAVALLPLMALLLLSSVSARGMADPTSEPTATVQPTPDAFTIDVAVETQGTGIPDSVVMVTDFGDRVPYRHDILGANHYRDFMKVHLDSSMMWIFEHEGDLGIGGGRSDESWEQFPVIVATPLTLTVSIQTVAPCQNPTIPNCNDVTGTGNQPVFTLDHNESYNILLNVDYTRGTGQIQDTFAVTSTIQ